MELQTKHLPHKSQLLSMIAHSAESGHPFRKLTDTFLENFFVLKLKHFIHFFSNFFALIHPAIR
ncbi:MAG: hypothetical protein K9G70_11865, partial [Prolixibacteraceae bacterium]|nr:hypothetical protein [Prolixibacteraceae bacterium]